MADDKDQPTTPADIKRAIKDSGGKLFVNTVDGKPWITETHWAAPITHQLAAFCETYGIPANEPGTWTVDNAKTAHSSTQEAPSFASVIPVVLDMVETAKGWREVFPCVTDFTGGAPVFVNIDRPAIVLATAEADMVTAASVEYLRVLGGGQDVATSVAHDDGRLVFTVDRHGRTKYRVRVFVEDVRKPLIVLVEHELVITKAGGGSEVTWPVDFRAVLMPVKI